MSHRKYYTGVGSRQTPPRALLTIDSVAARIAQHGYIMRSGGAGGADTAFAIATPPDQREIWVPWFGFNGSASKLVPTPEAFEIAAQHHPGWERLGRGARGLHARNVHQVLGADLKTPSRFVLCWTPDGAETRTSSETGGTGQAIRIAIAYGVPVINMQRPWREWTARVKEMVLWAEN